MNHHVYLVQRLRLVITELREEGYPVTDDDDRDALSDAVTILESVPCKHQPGVLEGDELKCHYCKVLLVRQTTWHAVQAEEVK